MNAVQVVENLKQRFPNEPEYIQPVLIDYIAKRLELSKIKL